MKCVSTCYHPTPSMTLVRNAICLTLKYLHVRSIEKSNFVGLQSVKTVLRVSANRCLLEPDETEENIVYRSLRDIIVPAIKPNDLSLFSSIIDDLFPKANSNNSYYVWLRDTFERKCDEYGYEPVDEVYKKLLEVYEMSVYRKGIVLMGNPYTGKSFVLKTLAAAIAAKHRINVNELDIGMIAFRLNI